MLKYDTFLSEPLSQAPPPLTIGIIIRENVDNYGWPLRPGKIDLLVHWYHRKWPNRPDQIKK